MNVSITSANALAPLRRFAALLCVFAAVAVVSAQPREEGKENPRTVPLDAPKSCIVSLEREAIEGSVRSRAFRFVDSLGEEGLDRLVKDSARFIHSVALNDEDGVLECINLPARTLHRLEDVRMPADTEKIPKEARGAQTYAEFVKAMVKESARQRRTKNGPSGICADHTDVVVHVVQENDLSTTTTLLLALERAFDVEGTKSSRAFQTYTNWYQELRSAGAANGYALIADVWVSYVVETVLHEEVDGKLVPTDRKAASNSPLCFRMF